MNRQQFDELLFQIREATGLQEVVIVGSQSALASHGEADLPKAATLSPEIDVVLAHHPSFAAVMSRLGLGTAYERREHVSVDVVSVATAFFPRGWEKRRLEYRPATAPDFVALCPEIHDLCTSKLARLERHDREFVAALMDPAQATNSRHAVSPDRLLGRIPNLVRLDGVDLDQKKKQRALEWVRKERQRLGA